MVFEVFDFLEMLCFESSSFLISFAVSLNRKSLLFRAMSSFLRLQHGLSGPSLFPMIVGKVDWDHLTRLGLNFPANTSARGSTGIIMNLPASQLHPVSASLRGETGASED